ncbi:hypothetical protein DPMN_148148 [Dreissena polymorpha]|uniref:Uncharacterized protein n=1 Tax=Dreissena polymorpha TaxID=45954 RepID=A0A9D4FB64_DREPO|nr:hypothetical protein DPMN_148148 [Dreissena polymorpha]
MLLERQEVVRFGEACLDHYCPMVGANHRLRRVFRYLEKINAKVLHFRGSYLISRRPTCAPFTS